MEGGLAGSAFAAGSLSSEARYVVLTGQGPERANVCFGWKADMSSGSATQLGETLRHAREPRFKGRLRHGDRHTLL